MGDSSPNAGAGYSLTIGDGPTEYVDQVPVGLFAQQLENLSGATDDVGNIAVDGVGSDGSVGSHGTMHLSELGNMYSDGSQGEMNLSELGVSGPNSLGRTNSEASVSNGDHMDWDNASNISDAGSNWGNVSYGSNGSYGSYGSNGSDVLEHSGSTDHADSADSFMGGRSAGKGRFRSTPTALGRLMEDMRRVTLALRTLKIKKVVGKRVMGKRVVGKRASRRQKCMKTRSRIPRKGGRKTRKK